MSLCPSSSWDLLSSICARASARSSFFSARTSSASVTFDLASSIIESYLRCEHAAKASSSGFSAACDIRSYSSLYISAESSSFMYASVKTSEEKPSVGRIMKQDMLPSPMDVEPLSKLRYRGESAIPVMVYELYLSISNVSDLFSLSIIIFFPMSSSVNRLASPRHSLPFRGI